MDVFDVIEEKIGFIKKENLVSFLKSYNHKVPSKILKQELIDICLVVLKENSFLQIKFYKDNIKNLSMPPSEVELTLGCTKTERKRWESEGKLKIIGTNMYKQYEYNLYDPLQITSISPDTLGSWREEHTLLKKKNKACAVKKAQKTKSINNTIREDFKKEWKKNLVSWYKLDSKLAITLELSYWTMWINRWAKENKVKSLKSHTKKKYYIEMESSHYKLKNIAMELLSKSPFCKISFYKPKDHQKIKFHLCDIHYNFWVMEREYYYYPKMAYCYDNKKEILKCKYCNCDIQNDYYSLFFFKIEDARIPDLSFSFHLPYSLGKLYLDKDNMNTLNPNTHIESEGLFRFGRNMLESEKIVHTEKFVLKNFNECIEKYKLYFE